MNAETKKYQFPDIPKFNRQGERIDDKVHRDASSQGIHRYVLKDCDKEELKTAILEVAEGNTFFSRGVTDKVIMEFSQLKREMNSFDVSSVSPF